MQLVKIMVGISTHGSILHASGKCAVSIEGGMSSLIIASTIVVYLCSASPEKDRHCLISVLVW